MLLRTSVTADARKGIILIVVLALLTLFAIVGLSFVFYAQSEADASRIFREQSTLRSFDDSPDRLWSFALSKLIYDEFDDTSGIYSAIRGHSLARSMYGFDDQRDPANPLLFIPNQIAFNGTGRLQSLQTPFGTPEFQAVNYTYFPLDNQLHDPERLGWRPFGNNPGPVTGGINVPYTYPDHNNMFLAAINANGQVLAPSFHRRWLGFGPLDPGNPNWTTSSAVNPALKYMVLRPRPADMGQGFPPPEDEGGDVKNLWWLPGPNDSIWIDLNYPVQIGPDGRKFKPLFAFFITDLDNRVNLNVHGNIRGQGLAHVSNQGWVKSEVSLARVLAPTNPAATPNEWQRIFAGIPTPGPGPANTVTVRGRYGWDLQPNDPGTYSIPNGNYAPSGTSPHLYGQVDFDGCQELNNFIATPPITLPNQQPPGNYSCFPVFPAGYGDGNQQERTNHPLIYDVFKPFSDPVNAPVPPDNRPNIDDRAFPVFEMKELLNGGLRADPTNPPTAANDNPFVNSANSMRSFLGLILPYNFNDPLDITGSLKRRSLVTTLSLDMSRPGIMPWMWDATNAKDNNNNPVGLQVNNRATPPVGYDPIMSPAPWGWASPFPSTGLRPGPIPANSEFTIPNGTPAPYPLDQTNWRAAINQIRQALGRLDLSRPLQPYPNQLVNPQNGQQNTNILRFDDQITPCPGDPQGRTIFAVYMAAQQDRVNLARDIYVTLAKLCAVPTVANSTNPTDTELMPRRWLAQLAVNIVDFIDSDNISTAFQFYPNLPGEGPPVDRFQTDTGTATSPNELYRYWVFGFEQPPIILNEILAEYTAPPPNTAGTVTVNVWAELFSPRQIPPTPFPAGVDQLDAQATVLQVPQGVGGPAYAPYQVVIANTNLDKDTLNYSQGGPLVPREFNPMNPSTPPLYNNDNVVGTPDQVRQYTDSGATTIAFKGNAYVINNPAGNNGTLGNAVGAPMTLSPQGYLFVGPGTNGDANNPAAFAMDGHGDFGPQPKYVASNPALPTLGLPTNGMTYQPQQTATNTWTYQGLTIQDKANGITVLLRRLANPYMPNNGPLAFNPFVTIDFMEGIPLRDTTQPYYTSSGKLQPYASHASQYVAQGPNTNPMGMTAFTGSTFGAINQVPQANNMQLPPQYDWLAHLDRQLVSPVELLLVSAYHPHEVTHRFVTPIGKQKHLANWFDQTSRLYRLWEFVEVTDRAYGVTSLGRRPGKININTVWDPEILMALLDPQPSNYFRQDPQNAMNPIWDIYNYNLASDPNTIYGRLMAGRTPNYIAAIQAGQPSLALSGSDRPFFGMGAGNIPVGDPNYPNGTGINDTFLRVSDMTQLAADTTVPPQGRPDMPRAFENPRSPNPPLDHPYLRFEPLNKMFNSLTSRSNVFAVWCTVGYFEVVDDTARPVKLGAEIGKANGNNVRHRFFGVIDRTELAIAGRLLNTAPAPGGGGTVQPNPTYPLLGPGTAWLELEMAPGGNAVAQFANGAIVGQTPANIPGRPPMEWSIAGNTAGANGPIPGTGSVLIVDRGTINEEWVQVIQVSQTQPPGTPPPSANVPVWIQAYFIRPHTNPGFGVTEPGNPGPQPPIDVRDYQHAPVVPVSVVIN